MKIEDLTNNGIKYNYKHEKIVNMIARGKIYATRTAQYINILTFGIVLLLYLKVQNISFLGYVLTGLGILLSCVFLGFLEDKIGLFKGEYNMISSRNPYLVETLKKVDKIERMLEVKDDISKKSSE